MEYFDKKQIFLREIFFWKTSWTLWRKFLRIQQKTIGRIAQTRFQMSRGPSSLKKCEEIFNLCTFFSHGAESFQTFGENHKFSKKMMISLMVLESEWKIETIGGDFLARLSKLPYWRPKETFFGKRWFHNFSETLSEKVSSFQANIPAGWPKLFSISREGISMKWSFAK